jgi:hypothetical protein
MEVNVNPVIIAKLVLLSSSLVQQVLIAPTPE